MATEQKLKGDWNQVAGKLKEKYGQLTDDDLTQAKGDSQQLIGMIQKKTGQASEQIEAFVHHLYETAGMQFKHLSEATSDYMGSTSQALHQSYDQVVDHARNGYEQTAQVIAKRPTQAVVAALAVGLIGGVMLGFSIASARRPEPNWRNGWRS